MRTAIIALTVALAPAWSAAATQPSPPTERPEERAAEFLLGPAFPIEARPSFPAALLHWLDSLTGLEGPGLTGGKTIPAHRRDYEAILGRPTAEDEQALRRHAQRRVRWAASAAPADRDALTLAFFRAGTLEGALKEAEGLVGAPEAAALRADLEHLASRYRGLWQDGKRARSFVSRARKEPVREELARFLIDVARFFNVAPELTPRPVVLLMPVGGGFGTHAQAIDHFLLIEIRPGEGLIDQVAPIVHENAHWLFGRMDPARRTALEQVAEGLGRRGETALRALHEALPTAIAQGVADQRFRPTVWSARSPWYHVEEVDAYAKRIFPLVRRALRTGGALDVPLAAELLEAYPVSPRSP